MSHLRPIVPLRFLPFELPVGIGALQAEVRDFVAVELAAGSFEPMCDSWLTGFDPAFTRRLGARGWLAMTWPKKYGGQARSTLERYVVTEELLAAGAPVAAHWIADRQSGPLLLRYGTEAQRQRLLPRMARGKCYFAIGMSEPDSGSDLASVRTRARQIDGGWVVNGTKLWTSGAHVAHFMITLVRTGPVAGDRHHGLSQLLIDLQSPGIDVRPVRLLSGEHHFNEVVLRDCFVPDGMVVGEPGEGWRQVTAELAFERSGPERFLSTFPLLAGMAQLPDAGAVVGRLTAELWALRQLSLSVAAALERGESPTVEAALVKDLGTSFEGAVAEAARGAGASDPDSPLFEHYRRSILQRPGFTLRGGTTEMLRTIVGRSLQ
jgi:acyl-CoA dehydrogenase